MPLNDRSEFVTPANFSDGGVSDTTFRFQDACAAFFSPARRRTRRPRGTAPRGRTGRTMRISRGAPFEGVEHAIHAGNFGGLIGVNIGREAEHDLLFSAPLRPEQL